MIYKHRMMNIRGFLIIAALLLTQAPRLFAIHTLNFEQKSVITAWLAAHPGYRIAEDRDCECDEDINSLRIGQGGAWKPVPDYHPYAASGDFNGDGVTDFAVVVIDKQTPRSFTLLVFNGPLDVNHPVPVFTWAHQNLKGTGLFFGPPRLRPYRLLIGPFESEGLIVQPKGETYRLKE